MFEDSSEFVSNEQQTSDERIELYRSKYFIVSKIRLFGKWRIEKRLTPEYEFQPLQRASLEREFEIGYQLEHPNIVRYLELRKTEQGDPYIIMEYVDGMNLQEYMQSDKNCTKKNFSAIFISLLSALSYLQQNQIYHLDIKPENIVVTYKEHIPKLIDFGVSNNDTYQTSLGATKQYSTDEHIDYSRVSSKTDMYSFAKTMAEFAKAKKIKLSPTQRKIIRVSLNENLEQRISASNAFALLQTKNHWIVLVIIFAIILIIGLLILVISKPNTPTMDAPHVTQKDTIYIAKKDTLYITQKDASIVRKEIPNTSRSISAEATTHQNTITTNSNDIIMYDDVLAKLQQDTKFKFSKEDSLFVVAEIIECKRKSKKLQSQDIHIVEDGIHTRAHIRADSVRRRMAITIGYGAIRDQKIDSMLQKYWCTGDYKTYNMYWDLKRKLDDLSLEELGN